MTTPRPISRALNGFWFATLVAAAIWQLTVRGQTASEPKPYWDTSLGVKFGAGYKDNVTLAHTAAAGGPFLQSGADAMLLWISGTGTEFYFFLDGEDARYLDTPGVEKEQTLVASAQLKRELGRNWRVGLNLEYLYQDQVFDASTTETFGTIRAQGYALTARPSIRRELPGEHWLELEAGITRQYFRGPLDHHWEGEPKFTIGRNWGHRTEIFLSYALAWQAFDRRSQIDVTGQPIPQSRLRFRRHAGQIVWRQQLGEARHWRSTVRLGFGRNEDNGGGYFDYDRLYAAGQLRYRAHGWEIQGQAKVGNFDYRIQTASLSDHAARNRLALGGGVRIEKQLSRHWKAYANYEHERVSSNRSTDEYQVNIVAAGVSVEF